ncbi:hypothetical protein [Thomasclavelia cocleata]|uniref:hypothetical protein n=1 Tax=Thomasclavelia cocleata TaxID=69824 RepID=UPI00258261A2|nr:hypothetical protein [Thomasclavelia cocleata]
MDITLTKLADKFLCSTYKVFLERRKQNFSLQTAKQFKNTFEEREPFILEFNLDDIPDILNELSSHKLIKVWISGSFVLETEGIVYMENRFKNGLKEVTDFIAKFIP